MGAAVQQLTFSKTRKSPRLIRRGLLVLSHTVDRICRSIEIGTEPVGLAEIIEGPVIQALYSS